MRARLWRFGGFLPVHALAGSAPARRALAGARIDDGEQLYAAADAVEIAWARTRA